ncbi:lipoyl(octanoyl) transferase LipB [Crocinitomicaceae bacterium]|nr:lipoyl(octanoyl) transferase LipB [Crocinitomicaceae bacterium]MDG2504939.1 lipoyl(octanoyl) transferase LipB [Crocinitomicaceae bacterium]
MKPSVIVHDIGLIDYQEAWDFQEELFKATVDLKISNRKGSTEKRTSNHLLFCEHPHVYTLGKSGKASHLLLNEKELQDKNAVFYKINRGGDITYHGPGQIVAYPILDLEQFFTDIHKYMRLLEEAVIRTIAAYGLKGGRIDGMTGVWLDAGTTKERKICALGVKASRWVTMHGIGFNVNTDLDYFSNIVPCGIEDKAVTSMKKELGSALNMDEVKSILLQELKESFGFSVL